jgi:pyruvyltransferase
MLLPLIYPHKSLNKNSKKDWDIGIIPHYIDKKRMGEIEIITNSLTYKIIDIESSPEEVIDLICRSRYVFSSSLHGLIVAHSYNVPTTWLKLSDNVIGGDFKFKDYLLSVGGSMECNPYNIVNNILDLQEGIEKSNLFDTQNNAKKLMEVMSNCLI